MESIAFFLDFQYSGIHKETDFDLSTFLSTIEPFSDCLLSSKRLLLKGRKSMIQTRKSSSINQSLYRKFLFFELILILCIPKINLYPSIVLQSLSIILGKWSIIIHCLPTETHYSKEYLSRLQEGTFLELEYSFRYFHILEPLRGQGKYLPLIRLFSIIVFDCLSLIL